MAGTNLEATLLMVFIPPTMIIDVDTTKINAIITFDAKPTSTPFGIKTMSLIACVN